MPEYLAPGVYVEETSYRAKSIEGVSTSTAGFIGPTRTGPLEGKPEVLTSFADFERTYGGVEDLVFNVDGAATATTNYLAHAARAFFDEGGSRLYVARIAGAGAAAAHRTVGGLDIAARDVGSGGNLRVRFVVQIGPNILVGGALSRVRSRDVLLTLPATSPPGPWAVREATRAVGGAWELRGTTGPAVALGDIAQARVVTVRVDVAKPTFDARGIAVYDDPVTLGVFGLSPTAPDGLLTAMGIDPPPNGAPSPLVLTTTGSPLGDDQADFAAVVDALFSAAVLSDPTPEEEYTVDVVLAGGTDGEEPVEAAYIGSAADPAMPSGLAAFEAIDDISIVAAPGCSALRSAVQRQAVRNRIVTHCEHMKYRVAVLDTPPRQTVNGARDFRNERSSTHAALYYPWVTVVNPFDGTRLSLPPSGFVAGIWARNDVEHAVFKAPANEVVRSAIDLEVRLSKGQQDVLNPDGVNCLRFFPRRGNLVWGARTITDDPEWKYVSVRRYFAYLEHSVDRGTQWAVFESNGEALWANVRRTIEDFLFNEWKMGALLGTDPKDAYFVRCDRSTMTQNDLDNGRLVCQVGVAVVKPAEFVIFRIGQWTATARN